MSTQTGDESPQTIDMVLSLPVHLQQELRKKCSDTLGDNILPSFSADQATQKQRRTRLLGTDQERQDIQSERNNISIQHIKQHQHKIYQLINQINETIDDLEEGDPEDLLQDI